MKRKSARFGVLLVALAGVVTTTVPSAQATTMKTITVTGNATLSTGFQYACATNPPTTACTGSFTTTKPGPKPGTTVVNNHPVGGRTANFSFSSSVCVKTSTSTGKIGIANKNGVDQCLFTAAGTITGFCGFSTGAGTLTLTNLTGTKASITMAFKLTGTGDKWRITAGNANEHIIGEVNATPATGSCAGAGATNFTVTGGLLYSKCTRFFLFSCF